MKKPHIRVSGNQYTIGFGRDAPFVYIGRANSLTEAWGLFLEARQIAWAFALNGYRMSADGMPVR